MRYDFFPQCVFLLTSFLTIMPLDLCEFRSFWSRFKDIKHDDNWIMGECYFPFLNTFTSEVLQQSLVIKTCSQFLTVHIIICMMRTRIYRQRDWKLPQFCYWDCSRFPKVTQNRLPTCLFSYLIHDRCLTKLTSCSHQQFSDAWLNSSFV